MNIGERIKICRTNKGLSQKEVALNVGIDQAQYSRIESSKVEPTISSIEKIAEALNISVSDLFSEDKSIDINSYDKSIIDRLKLLEELEETEKQSIFNIIDIAVSRKRLKDNLSNVLNGI